MPTDPRETDAARRSPEEIRALRDVLKAGAAYGYGNCIQALQFAWAKKMKAAYNFDDAEALAAGLVSEAWESTPKTLSKKKAAALMAFGESVLAGLE